MQEIFSDINIVKTKFRTIADGVLNEGENGEFKKILNSESVKKSIMNLLFTKQGEIFYDPRKGSKIEHFLHEKSDPITSLAIQREIVNTISNYEPRISNLNVSVSVNEEYVYTVDISYDIDYLNYRDGYTFDLKVIK